MKSLTKTLVVAGVMGTLGTGALFTGAVANAESGTSISSGSGDPMTSLVEKIATQFNLDKTKVQQVFDDQRAEMDTKRAQEQKDRLQKMVDTGTITTAQKTAIEAKLAEMKTEREANKDAFQNMTDDQRKAAMDKKHTDLEEWAKTQGLDLTKLGGVLGGLGGPHGPRG